MPPVRATLLILLAVPALYAQGVIQTIAGSDWLFPDDGKPALGAALGAPTGAAVDAQGNVYFADLANFMVYRVDTAGIIRIVAGNGIRGYSGNEGPATSAALGDMFGGVAVDSQGNIYIAENSRIRRITPDGIIHPFAGSDFGVPPQDGLPALNVILGSVSGLSVDLNGNLCVTVFEPARVYKISPQGILTIIAGNGQSGYSGDGVPATATSLNSPRNSAVGPDGSVYIADTANYRIRRVAPNGTISTFAGNGVPGNSGVGGPAVSATIFDTPGIVTDAAGNVYFTQSDDLLQVDTQGILRRVAFLNQASDGLARSAAGNFYIPEGSLRRVQRVTSTGTVTTFAGEGKFRFSAEGTPAREAFLFEPEDVAVAPDGSVYIADTGNFRVWRIGLDGNLVAVAGDGSVGLPLDGSVAKNGPLFKPYSLAFEPNGNLLISAPAIIFRVTPAGSIFRVAGNGGGGFSGDGGPAVQAMLEGTLFMAADPAGNIYVSDSGNGRIRRIGLDGNINTIAGNGSLVPSGDGGPALQAGLGVATGLAFGNGSIFFGDATGSGRVRQINLASGIISTVSQPGSGVVDLSRGSNGNLFVATTFVNRVLVLSPAGAVTATVGTGDFGFDGDGGPPSQALLNNPRGLAVDGAGRPYIADTFNHRIRTVDAVPPTFQVSATTTLNFTASSAGLPPPPQSFDISGSALYVGFTVATSTVGGGSWLSATPASAVMPARLKVSVNPAGLAPGVYQGTVTVTAPAAFPAVRSVAVQFTVQSALPPILSVEPAGLAFTLVAGTAAARQQLRITNTGGGSLTFAASATTVTGGSWLSVTPGSGNATPAAPEILSVTANPQALGPGTFSGSVTITSAGFAPVQVPVTLAVTAAPQRILLSQVSLNFTAVALGGIPPPQSFLVLNGGAGTLSWTAATSTLAGGPQWLSLSSTSGSSSAGSAPPPVEVRVNHTGLSAGQYYGRIDVSGVAANSPQTLVVVLNVVPAGQNPGPIVQPSGLVFTGVAGDSSPGSQIVQISSVGAAPLSFESGQAAVSGGNQFLIVPANGTAQPGQPFKVLIQPDSKDLPPGVYLSTMTLLFQDSSVRTVSIVMVLTPSSQAGFAGFREAAAGCAPTRLLPVVTTIGSDFDVPAGWPVAVVTRIVDDCATPLATGSVIASFSNGDPPLSLSAAGDGNWSATWAPRGGTRGVTITVEAETSDRTLRGSAAVTGGQRANTEVPVVDNGGILSAASYELQAPLSPGSFASIFGSRLSDAFSAATTLPLDTQRAGTEVIVGGRSLPLHFTSQGQVNAILPYDLTVNTSHQLIVMRGNALSVPQTITVAPARPAVFATNSQGFGQGHIYVASAGNVLTMATPQNPARAGDVLVLYAAGLGAVDPPVAAGTAAPITHLASAVNPVTATIGGVAARVEFAGLAPGFAAGLYQVNITVPTGITPGDAVPLVLTQNGQPSPPVTMAIR